MIVLVTGGRDFDDHAFMFGAILTIHKLRPISLLVHGDARGADKLSGVIARELGIKVKPYPADWKKLGKRAGPVRNRYMHDDACPDMVLAFPGGTGTADMVGYAHEGVNWKAKWIVDLR